MGSGEMVEVAGRAGRARFSGLAKACGERFGGVFLDCEKHRKFSLDTKK